MMEYYMLYLCIYNIYYPKVFFHFWAGDKNEMDALAAVQSNGLLLSSIYEDQFEFLQQ